MPPHLWYNGGATIEIRRKAGICKAVDEPLSKSQICDAISAPILPLEWLVVLFFCLEEQT